MYNDFLNNKEMQRRTYRYDYMSRILYIYAKLNPMVKYMQGMNEILAPIFYIINQGKPPDRIDEACCFFMFNNAIADTIELRIMGSESENYIKETLNQVNDMLVVFMPKVWSKLDRLQIDPFYYCYRWITLHFTQEFQLPTVLRIWESIFSVTQRLKFMKIIAVSILLASKHTILKKKNDFVKVLAYLQKI
jgi:hypothetical protein